jgi:NAD(P)-dependent dehydrogenase (short-subunit alcohol dehydrogenase family)
MPTPASPAAPTSACQLDGRIALVTGATHGIGRAIAVGLGREGAQVVAVGRTQGALESLDDEIRACGGSAASLVELDLRDGDGVDRLGAALYERHGRLDILIGAAGFLGLVTPVAHLDQKVWDQVMAVNLTANYRLIRSMDPLLRRAEAGRVVLLSSGVARDPRAFWGAYAVSKAGLEALAAVYADEVDNTPIRVAVINPGPMRTRMRAKAYPGEDPDTLPAPEEIVPMVLEVVCPGSSPLPKVANFRDWRATAD